MAKNKLYWEKEKKREKERKEKKKKKEKERKVKKRMGEAIRNKNKNLGEYILILYILSPLTSPGTCLSSWPSGGGACCADFQVLALGGAAQPLAWCRAQ